MSRPVRALVFLIQLYRHTISPLRLPTCRFMPTCSQYAVEALTEFGLLRGTWLALVRLLKCGPWHNGGWDPIPDRHPDCHGHSDAMTEPGRGGPEDSADDRDRPLPQEKSQLGV
ncbi:membrane protein insertion efficiency factor YidD [Mycobacterium sp. SMC-4]|uniref:membrane protein insertion efficiency factor YidD n=1 Tax=Mycobacterium sp. SMC-4 TaxID=2857059 RepID=UPI0021B48108|nr:membrane protein insertion efficiency factor YidD [Mycobacterium sp. SMC-4]UXA18161.1 membrane protein insertion efficiency factor YidD [Mycobacterium sp. SMC-4]